MKASIRTRIASGARYLHVNSSAGLREQPLDMFSIRKHCIDMTSNRTLVPSALASTSDRDLPQIKAELSQACEEISKMWNRRSLVRKSRTSGTDLGRKCFKSPTHLSITLRLHSKSFQIDTRTSSSVNRQSSPQLAPHRLGRSSVKNSSINSFYATRLGQVFLNSCKRVKTPQRLRNLISWYYG